MNANVHDQRVRQELSEAKEFCQQEKSTYITYFYTVSSSQSAIVAVHVTCLRNTFTCFFVGVPAGAH